MFSHFRVLAAASLCALFAAIPMAANAADAGAAPRVAVHADDLNLATKAGRTVLQNRVALAVEKVCAPVEGRTPWEVQAYRACRKNARAGAAPQVEAIVAHNGQKVAVERGTASVQ